MYVFVLPAESLPHKENMQTAQRVEAGFQPPALDSWGNGAIYWAIIM